ncbi:unnamed protein product [Microthlaspi erraticum]|uniref:Uncharacterized protein n=1 Tax=Microthlaspi erraticum TaxID=1685480 RepID=A0A6D2HPA9_9BRAS|nr:unnamed protein product [Microthlaspi erraticum]
MVCWSERYRHPTREIQIIPELIGLSDITTTVRTLPDSVGLNMLGGVEVSPPPQLFPGLIGISNIIVRHVRPDISWSSWSERYRHPTREIQIIPELIGLSDITT